MKIKTVNASIRKTVETPGQWRGVELGAEAEIEPNEDWRSAQAALTKQLQEQMKAIFLPFHQGDQEAPPAQQYDYPQPQDHNPRQPQANGNGQHTDQVCPTHGKARKGRWGMFCPTRLENGDFCKWKEDE